MSKAKKVIPAAVDVPGRRVCWKPSISSDILYGEVISVHLRMEQCPKYSHARVYKKVLKVIIGDGRIFTLSGEHENLKKIGMAVVTAED
jgi:hypothetical protein